MTSGLKAEDIGNLPPIDTSGEIKVASKLLALHRKQREASKLSKAYALWVARSYLAGVEAEEEPKQ